MTEEMYPLTFEGGEMYLAKGDMGERVGEYVLLFAIDSVEARNRAFGPPGGRPAERSEEVKRVLARYGTFCPASFTDYVVVGK